jgi:predicted secreted protein
MPRRPPGRRRDGDTPGRLLRAAEATAGLLSGGLLVLGLALLVLQFVAPDLVPGTGFSAPAGPGWGRIAAHLAVGAVGEGVVAARCRLPRPVRGALATAVIAAVLAVLWFCWWS